MGRWNDRTAQGSDTSFLLPCFVTTGKLHELSKPRFPPLLDEADTAHPAGL